MNVASGVRHYPTRRVVGAPQQKPPFLLGVADQLSRRLDHLSDAREDQMDGVAGRAPHDFTEETGEILAALMTVVEDLVGRVEALEAVVAGLADDE